MRTLFLAVCTGLLLVGCGGGHRSAPGQASASSGTDTHAADSARSTPSTGASAGTTRKGSGATSLTAVAQTGQEGADTGKGDDSSETALEKMAPLPASGQLPGGHWQAGKNFNVILPAQPTSAGPGRVEVLEFFWYGCPHCYALEPAVAKWIKDKANYVDFERVPVMWSPEHVAHARFFYSMKLLGKLDDMHSRTFDEIHKNGNALFVDGNDQATMAAQTRFAVSNSITATDFTTAYNSFTTHNDLARAEDLGRRYEITSVPTFVIAGKYSTDGEMAGGSAEDLMRLVTDLASFEHHH